MNSRLRRSGTFFGQTLNRFRADDLLLVESCFEPGFKSPAHSHERPFCYLVLAGTSTQTCGNSARESSRSHLVFHPAGEVHSDHWHETGGRCLHVEFGPRWLERVRAHSQLLDRPTEFRGGTPVWLMARLYQELRSPDDLSHLAVEGLALELVAQAARCSALNRRLQPPPWLRRVKELAAVRFRERLTLAEMALEAGVHPVHLVTVFRRYLHRTPSDFLRQLRVEFAAAQLVGTEAPVAEIALDAGFSHHSHFCRVFKNITGMTPAAYRELFARQS